MTEFAKWLSKKLGLNRPYAPVSTDHEKEFFNKSYARFLNYDVKEADNFHTVAFGKFALFWNECVAEEEAGRRPKTSKTLKSSFQLQAYWKKFKREGNQASTLLPVDNANKKLRNKLRYAKDKDIPGVAKINILLVQASGGSKDQEKKV